VFKHCPVCNKTEFNIFLSQHFIVDTEDYIPKKDDVGEYMDHATCVSCGYKLTSSERESLEELLVWSEQE
jgi:hypothetical protein